MKPRIDIINIWRMWEGMRRESTSELHFKRISGVSIGENDGQMCVKIEGSEGATVRRRDYHPNGETHDTNTAKFETSYFIPCADILGAMWVGFDNGTNEDLTILDIQKLTKKQRRTTK